MILGIAMLAPSIIGSMGGGRSLYNLNIQSSKIYESYDQIIGCAPYYLSYPIGKYVLPNYEGVCHQNDVTKDMPGYDANPYVIAEIKREGEYKVKDWALLIISNPFKYLIILVVSMCNIFWFEGIYPSIIQLLPLPVMVVGYLFCKILLSGYLWYKVIKVIKYNWLYSLPLLYFMLVVGNFPIEPRYFYPLIPYIYFLSGLDHNKKKI
jgi:hypothetical protein